MTNTTNHFTQNSNFNILLNLNYLSQLNKFGLNPFHWIPVEITHQLENLLVVFENVDDPEFKLVADIKSLNISTSQLHSQFEITNLSLIL